jgi:hypothetical protein
VRVRDRFLNPASLAASRGKLSVVVTPPGREPPGLDVMECGGGEYRVAYDAPPASGVYELSVALDFSAAAGGRHEIYNSPFRVFFRPGEVDPDRCWATGRGLVAGGVGLPCRIVMHAADALGNHALSGGLRWHVAVVQPAPPGPGRLTRAMLGEAGGGEGGGRDEDRGGDEVGVATWDYGNGVYACEFVPVVPGRYGVENRLVGRLVGGRVWRPAVHELPEWRSDEARPPHTHTPPRIDAPAAAAAAALRDAKRCTARPACLRCSHACGPLPSCCPSLCCPVPSNVRPSPAVPAALAQTASRARIASASRVPGTHRGPAPVKRLSWARPTAQHVQSYSALRPAMKGT